MPGSTNTPTAVVCLPAPQLEPTLEYFTDCLGFRVDLIYPADAPRVAELSGHGLCIRLERDATHAAGELLLRGAWAAHEERAPNGTRVRFEPAEQPVHMPAARPELVLSRAETDASWSVGRAGMRYRDLIPSRWGGFCIASHIHIPEGGPVPDYVHFHRVHFQMIYVRRGWVKVVYEDQGAPFVMHAGDCVLQPPQIRHRVLECSAGLEVIEIGCPAEHETRHDPALQLPTGSLAPERAFGGQRFVRHIAAQASWSDWHHPGFEMRDTGIETATQGLALARVLRPSKVGAHTGQHRHDTQLLFGFVLDGELSLELGPERVETLRGGDAFAIPPAQSYGLRATSTSFELLELTLSASETR